MLVGFSFAQRAVLDRPRVVRWRAGFQWPLFFSQLISSGSLSLSVGVSLRSWLLVSASKSAAAVDPAVQLPRPFSQAFAPSGVGATVSGGVDSYGLKVCNRKHVSICDSALGCEDR